MVLPTVAWALLHQVAVKTRLTDTSPGRSDLDNSLDEVCFSQVTLDGLRLTI